MTINFSRSKDIEIKQLEELYNDVGWSAYTQDLEVLKQAILQSLDVITVWNDDKLVGLIRAIGDGLTIVYIQDILVLNAYQNKGIASELLQRILNKYKNVRQKVLLIEHYLTHLKHEMTQNWKTHREWDYFLTKNH